MRLLLTGLVVLLASSPGESFEQGWTLIRSSGGVETYVNETTDDGYKEYRGVTEMTVTFEEARDAIKDIPGNIHWLPSCRRSELIRKLSETEFLVYVISRAPWPFKDRDCVWKHQYLIDTTDHFRLVFTASDDPFDGEPGLVRILKARGVWEVKRIDRETTEVSFQHLGDGGGTVPRGFVNSSTKRIPEKTLSALYEYIVSLRGDDHPASADRRGAGLRKTAPSLEAAGGSRRPEAVSGPPL